MRNRLFPNYPDDTDYTTNANSYYDDLARKQKLVRLLAERIWGYEEVLNETLEEIQERFRAWDKKLEDFPEDVKVLLQKWLDDGTLDHIINDTIFNWKLDKTIFEQFQNSINTQLAEIENIKADEADLMVERSRIDAFTSLAEGSTTGDAELIDGKIGADGYTYPNIGEAIRRQITDRTEDVRQAIYHGYAKNNITITSFESGLINSTGVLVEDSRYLRGKDFIPTSTKKIVALSGYSFYLMRYNLSGVFSSRLIDLVDYEAFDFTTYQYKLVLYKSSLAPITLEEYNNFLVLSNKLPLQTDIDNIHSNLTALEWGYEKHYTESSLFEFGSINASGNEIPTNTYIRTREFISPDIDYVKSIGSYHFMVARYDLDGVYVSRLLDLDDYTFDHNLYKFRIVLYNGLTTGTLPTMTIEECSNLLLLSDKTDHAKRVEALESKSVMNKFKKTANTCIIEIGKARYTFMRHTNAGRALDTWRIYQGDAIDGDGVIGNMFIDSDVEGAIKELGASDFIGGYHGDETFSTVTFILDGKTIDSSLDYDVTFSTLDIFVYSKLYHADTIEAAFDRVKHLEFKDNTMTVYNKYNVLSNFIVDRASTALFNIYKQDNGVDLIYNYTDNVSMELNTIPQGTTTDTSLLYDANLTNVKFFGNGFKIETRLESEKTENYVGFLQDYGSQNRIKIYFDVIKQTTGGTPLNTGDVLKSAYSVSVS